MESDGIYLRYYVGHVGQFGHESLEFEFRPDGLLRYSNNTRYRREGRINKQVYVSKAVLNELKRIVQLSEVMKENDSHWPYPDRQGRQELEIVLGKEHISFSTTKIGTVSELDRTE
ncbi:Protein mago nashi [Thelohanellus kitauei]|uniref:Protein mago nashi n=1 Tax=Thelohanellus kitauei TaxID=669202 RepID=A0A0C2J382_THEKT|nr:Protein mago nashi [Thelohanellus kitauei]